MTPYERLERCERAAVKRLRSVPDSARQRTAERLAGRLNALAARWGCHYTVFAHHVLARKGGDSYGFGRP